MELPQATLVLLTLVGGVALSWRGSRWTRIGLFGSAVLVTAMLFLPGPQLASIVGKDAVMALKLAAAATPWQMSDWLHFAIFAWLGCVLWVGRPDLRGWRAGAVVAVLAVVAEVAQSMAPGRGPGIADALLNLGGGLAGLLVGFVCWRTSWSGIGNVKRPVMSTIPGDQSDWAADLLVGRPVSHGSLSTDVLQVASAEGVVSLLNTRLHASPFGGSLHTTARESLARAATQQAAHSLRVVAECRKVSAELEAAGIQAIWLKGVALSQWLYPAGWPRDIADADLLFASHADAMRAAALLAPQGFQLPNPHVAGDLVVNELLAKSRTGLELDLHWALGNGPLYARRLRWDELLPEAQPLPGLGPSALGLSAVHALLHACMHLMVNRLVGQGNRLRWLYDIHLLGDRLSAAEWAQFQTLAIERGLAGTCQQALLATQARLGTALPNGLMESLARQALDEPLRCEHLGAWYYRQRAEWKALPKLHQRLRWARQVLFPDLAHLRMRYGGDNVSLLTVLWRRLTDGIWRWRRYRSAEHRQ